MAGRNIRNGAAYGSETVVGIYSCCKRLDFVRCIKNDRVIKVYCRYLSNGMRDLSRTIAYEQTTVILTSQDNHYLDCW